MGSILIHAHSIGAPYNGPRYDHTGALLPHSVLGRAEDYVILSGEAEQVIHKLLNHCTCTFVHVAASSERDRACGMVC